MARLGLRTQLLVATLLIVLTLLTAVLLVVRHSMQSEIAEGLRQSTKASLQAVRDIQQERDLQLVRTAAMLAKLPTLKGALVLNALEASAQTQREIEIDIRSFARQFEIRVTDHGPGVPPSIRETLFDPFVSFGKSTGSGLGLAIVNKIIHDHAGHVAMEATSHSGTTFLVKLRRAVSVLMEAGERAGKESCASNLAFGGH